MKKIILTLCTAAVIAACSQKQGVVEVPVTKIDVEQLNKQIDYNMDVTGLGTGALYTNNIDLPLQVVGEKLWLKGGIESIDNLGFRS